jgi:hypothetical protein
MLGTVLGCVFSMFSAMAGMIMAMITVAWFMFRITNRNVYEAKHGYGKLYEILHDYKRVIENSVDTMYDMRFSGTKLCRTCQNPYGYARGLCPALHDIFPHYPTAEPPDPNPYEWSWYKANGYPLPPPNWSKERVYVDPRGSDLEGMKEDARPYYETYGNQMWDMGYGDIPNWYIDNKVKEMVSRVRYNK